MAAKVGAEQSSSLESGKKWEKWKGSGVMEKKRDPVLLQRKGLATYLKPLEGDPTRSTLEACIFLHY